MHEADPQDLVAEQQREDERAERSARQRQVLASLWAWQMQGPRGRAFVRALIASCGVFDPIADLNALVVQRKLARRDLGLELRAEAERLCFAECALMDEEGRKERDGNRNRNADETGPVS